MPAVVMRFAILPLVVLTLSSTCLQAATEAVHIMSGTNRLAGLLALPDTAKGRPPVIVFAPATKAGGKERFVNPTPATAAGRWQPFLDLGIACLAWDSPAGLDAEQESFNASVIRRIDEVIAAVDYVTNRVDLDTANIGLWGAAGAGWVLPQVAASVPDVKFVLSVSCPAQTLVEESAGRLADELRQQGVDGARATLAREHFIQKWVALRNGASFADATKATLRSQRGLPGVSHPWLDPFPLETYVSLSTNRAELESFFYNPLAHLAGLDTPAIALFGGRDTNVNPGFDADGQARQFAKAGLRNLKLVKIPGANHRMLPVENAAPEPAATQWVPQYWTVVRDFLSARLPALAAAPTTNAATVKQSDFKLGELAIRLSFKDPAALDYELNFESLTRRAIVAYTNLFGGLPRKAGGAPYDYVDFDIYHGNVSGEADPQYVSIDVGPQKVFGYLDWQTALIHEIFHLWNAETFRYRDYREQWFNEGATEYYAIKHALRFGVLNRNDAVDIWSRSFANYLTAHGTGSISMRDAGRKELKREHYFLVYHGGLVTSLVLDLEIRHLTRNQRSLDDLMRWLYRNSNRTSKPYHLDMLVEGLAQITGNNFTEFFARHVHGREILPVGRYLPRMELEAIREGKIEEIDEPRRAALRGALELP